MQAECHSRSLPLPIGENLDKLGISLGDHFDLFPLYGNRKKVILKRTKILFSNGFKQSEGTSRRVWLSSFKNESLSFCLDLCAQSSNASNSEKGRFLLKSLNNYPFKLNGNLCFEAFVELGDSIYLGHNKLIFNKSGRLIPGTLDHQILSNERVLRSEMNILIQGETGTGKSYLSKRIHEESGKLGKFVHVNLSSFSPSLIESELFGHKKGSFTGAHTTKLGAIAEANEGTLFIDEIDSLPYAIQTKLLLFLDNKKIRPVGGNSESQVNVRLIFASGQKLNELVRIGKFRADFYYRISSGFITQLLPLRENTVAIETLIDQFCINHNLVLSHHLKSFYKTLPWPGNIRQLLAHLDRKRQLTTKRKICFDELDEYLIKESSDLRKIDETKIYSLKDIKKEYAFLIYQRLNQNLQSTAERLKITKKTL
ncbi:MAG: transcriptional regulator of acetoin/glycerol metabolism, partial [Thermoproteota archaeon]